MITQLNLTNFQCHKSRSFDLAKITVFTGDNDQGKSSVLRALRWVALNQWDGKATDFISWGQGECQVELRFEKHVLARVRGKDNLYVLDGQEYRAFGQGVPDKISQALRIIPDSFQQQHDPAFWLMLTSGQAASALNEIFNLSAIDQALGNTASELRSARSRVQVSKERLKEAREGKKKLSWVVETNGELKKLERLQEKIDGIQKEEERLRALTDKARKGECLQANATRWLAIGKRCLQLDEGQTKLLGRISDLRRRIRNRTDESQLEDEQCQLEKQLLAKETLLTKYLFGKCPLCNRQ